MIRASILGCFLTALAPGLRAVAQEIDFSAGKRLAEVSCSGCHEVPSPDLLTRESWEFCLTYMGFFLGISDTSALDDEPVEVREMIRAREDFVRTAGLFPATPALAPDEWRAVRRYYTSQARETPLPQVGKPPIPDDPSRFVVMPTHYRQPGALTSLVRIDEARGQLLVHDALAERLTILDRDGALLDRHEAPGVALVDAEFRGDEILLLNIGDLFASRIGRGFGELQRARIRGGLYFGLEVLLEGLHRPCDFTLADLDNDGTDEVLISNFGDYTGNLSLYRRDGASGRLLPDPVVIDAGPGIVKTAVHDFDGDGRLDLVVLAGGAWESLSIHLNQGGGRFARTVLASRPPTFGYTGLALGDFDGDGRMDILTVNGDNGDSDPYNTLKRDHGIRIHINRGDLRFEEAFFHPMHGAFGAVVEDFDLDGDLDIAAIAFHPDFGSARPENFVFLEQTAPLVFLPTTHPATRDGRWLTITAGDLDGDGDKDIVLGAGYSPVGMRVKHAALLRSMLETGPPLLVLENQRIE